MCVYLCLCDTVRRDEFLHSFEGKQVIKISMYKKLIIKKKEKERKPNRSTMMKMMTVGLLNALYPFTSQAHRTVHAVKETQANQIKQAHGRLISFFTLGGGVSQCSNSTTLGSEQMSFQVSPKGVLKA